MAGVSLALVLSAATIAPTAETNSLTPSLQRVPAHASITPNHTTDSNPQSADDLIRQAITAIAVEEYAAAESMLRQVISAEPNNAIAHHLLGQSLTNQAEIDGTNESHRLRLAQAETAYQEAMQLDPNLEEAFVDLIGPLYQDRRFHEMEVIIRAVIRINPNNSEYYEALATMIAAIHPPEIAIAKLRDEIATFEDQSAFYLQLSIVHELEDRDAESEAVLREGIQIHPTAAKLYRHLGYKLTRQARYTEAISIHQAEVQLNPDSPYPYRNLAEAFKGANRLEEAEAAYRAGVTQNPNSLFIHHELADFLSEQAQYEEAEIVYRTATQIVEGPEKMVAFSRLHQFLRSQGRIEEANNLDFQQITD
ncbi:MAG: tetratricopeptide repeat protein [Cyanobacteria bacterium P01_D01_bin.36]